MNYGISVLFQRNSRVDGVDMLFLWEGISLVTGSDAARCVAGPVVFSLGVTLYGVVRRRRQRSSGN